MKKNKTMRLASGLLVAVLLTTCAISGTFAKYVTSDSSEDSARVAKWGVSVVASGDQMFNNEYTDTTNGLTVKSVDDKKVVAPGTSNEEFDADGLTFTIEGKPEVAVKITYDFTIINDIYLGEGTYKDNTTGDDTAADYTVDTNGYYPVVFTLTKGGTEVATGNLAAIKAYFDTQTAASTKIAANTTLDATYVLTWAWDFGDSANNKKDTTLGNLAAGTITTTNEYSLNLGYKLAITIEQVD